MIGLLGGGQLGRMMIEAAHRLGQKVVVLDPDPAGPAAQIADQVICAPYTDFGALARLAQAANVFTTEFENVPAESLRYLARHGKTMPSADCVGVAQNRIEEKAFIKSAGVEVAPYAVIVRLDDCNEIAPQLFPAILKSARLGYDGKGQVSVHDAAQTRRAWVAMGSVPCVLEKRLPLEREISVICARNEEGAIKVFPVGENVHRNGILAVTQVPARVPPALADRATRSACDIANALQYVGVLCVEFFVLSGDRLVANEMAPRPHNSGHYSIEACTASQFEQQVRICAGMPLAETALRQPAVMLNVLGEAWFGSSSRPVEPDWESVRAIAGVSVHLYGKTDPRAGRKMAHITCLADTLKQAQGRAQTVADLLGLDVGTALCA